MENQLNKIKDYFDNIGASDYKVISEGKNKPFFKFIYNDIEYITPEIDYITFDNVKKEIDKLLNIKELNSDDIVEKEKYLRLYSEFDNYRKRTRKEIDLLTKTASKRVMLEILDLVDDFERALTHYNESGLELIYNKFKVILINNGVETYTEIGDEFDSDIHEAVVELVVDDINKNKIIDIISKGYKMNNEIIRYAKVVVGKK
jgi:molecular chaperone GrpE